MVAIKFTNACLFFNQNSVAMVASYITMEAESYPQDMLTDEVCK